LYIPRLRRLQNLLHPDLWLTRIQHIRDQPKGLSSNEVAGALCNYLLITKFFEAFLAILYSET
jgi:hypothetical protein